MTESLSRRVWHDRVYLALGSNLGDREAALKGALAALGARADVRVEAVAAFRATAPVGPVDQPVFLNTVCRVATTLPSEALLIVAQGIERRFGRDRLREKVRWGPRVLDIDLVFYDDEDIDTPVAVIPHPEYRRRAFVMDPLLELAPDFRDPATGVPVRLYRERLDAMG